jgi:predicted Zn-dependent protease
MNGVALRATALWLASVLAPAPLAGEPARSAEERALWERAAAWEDAYARSPAMWRDEALLSYLDGVARRVYAQMSPPSGVTPRLLVLRQPMINAAAFPNGFVVLHTGILARLENEAQLATLLGHELAHFVRRHSLREKRARRSAERSERLTRALSLGLASSSSFASAVERQVSGYSQQLELEADRAGFEAMGRAGYEIRASARLFDIVLLDEEKPTIEDPFYYADHPSMAARAAHYRDLIAQSPQLEGELGAERYAAAVRTATEQNVRDDLALARVRSARRGIDRLLAEDGANAEAHFLEGEWHRLAGEPGRASTAAATVAYEKSTQREPGHAAAWRGLGLALRDLGRAAEAIPALERAIELAPDALDRPILAAYVKELRNELARAAR